MSERVRLCCSDEHEHEAVKTSDGAYLLVFGIPVISCPCLAEQEYLLVKPPSGDAL